MTDATPQSSTPPAPAAPRENWPEDPVEMLNEMLSEQAASLHVMFSSLRDFATETFQQQSPYAAQAYIRLALRAQTNCRSALDALARADRVTRRNFRDSEK